MKITSQIIILPALCPLRKTELIMEYRINTPPETFVLLPWRPKENHAVARMFCDVLKPGGEPFEGNPRYVLKRNLERAASLGYTYYVGSELEYFYFKDPHGTELLDAGATSI